MISNRHITEGVLIIANFIRKEGCGLSEKLDRRVIRTKQLLRKALLDLMEEKGIERITVKDLTDKANINRGTFYLHYQDAYDLLDQIKEEMLAGLSVNIKELNPLEFKKYAEKGEAYPGSVKIVQYMEKNADFFRIAFSPRGDFGFSKQITQLVKELMRDNVFKHVKDALEANTKPELQIPPDYLFAYISSAQLGLMRHWFETGRELPPHEVAAIATRMVYYGSIAASGIKIS